MSEANPTPTPKRHSFQLSLAWAFVFFAILCGLLVHVRTRINFRHARWYATGEIGDAGGWVEVDDAAERNMGFFARRLDDDPIERVVLTVGISLEEADRIQGLFPEAKIEWRTFP